MSQVTQQRSKPKTTLENALQHSKPDENVSKVINHLVSNLEFMETKSDLNPQQIIAMARGSLYGKKFQTPSMDSFIKFILSYLVSKDRKGRTELVDALKGAFVYEAEKNKPKIEL